MALEKEITVLMRFRHENFLGFLGLTREHPDAGSQPLIVTPYARNGMLLLYPASNANANANPAVALRDGVAGLKYLHTLDATTGKNVVVIHGDIHPRNVLIMDNGEGVLVDFGQSKIVKQGGAMSLSFRPGGTAVGLAKYTAPEEIKPDQGEHTGRRTVKSDEFALGMLLVDVYGGDATPTLEKQDMVITASLIKGDGWRPEAAKRPAIKAVLALLADELLSNYSVSFAPPSRPGQHSLPGSFPREHPRDQNTGSLSSAAGLSATCSLLLGSPVPTQVPKLGICVANVQKYVPIRVADKFEK
ncbi:kinase-like protein [Auricularia subglabra TFB-10046 SS5]|nr:kinase-like protein [Auricularia subglabra TFB-10046 SS5]